jgi:hypothetical protein
LFLTEIKIVLLSEVNISLSRKESYVPKGTLLSVKQVLLVLALRSADVCNYIPGVSILRHYKISQRL